MASVWGLAINAVPLAYMEITGLVKDINKMDDLWDTENWAWLQVRLFLRGKSPCNSKAEFNAGWIAFVPLPNQLRVVT